MNDETNDAIEELCWLQGYVHDLENGITEMRKLINESRGVDGYHLNGALATWDELLIDSLFSIAETFIAERKAFPDIDRPITEQREVLYIKNYPQMACTVQYTAVYGGQKYIRVD